jgi:hypothetical protein
MFMKKILAAFFILTSGIYAYEWDPDATVNGVEWDAQDDALFLYVTRSNSSPIRYKYQINTSNQVSISYAHAWEAIALTALSAGLKVDVFVVSKGTDLSLFKSIKIHQ